MNCPLCGSAAPFDDSLGFHVCSGCREMLTPTELVKKAARRTRHGYAKAHGYPKNYWKTGAIT